MNKKNKRITYLSLSLILGGTFSLLISPNFLQKNPIENTNDFVLQTNSFANNYSRYEGVTTIAPQIVADNTISNFYPIELLLSNNLPKLRSVIASLVINPANSVLSPDNINILPSEQNNVNGTINLNFQITNYNAIINNNNTLIPVETKEFLVSIIGLKNAQPSIFPTAPVNISPLIKPTDNIISMTNERLINELLPRVFSGTQISGSTIIILEGEPERIFPSQIKLVAKISNYFSTDGKFNTVFSNPVNITLTNFNVLLNSDYQKIINAKEFNLDIYPTQLNIDNLFPVLQKTIINLSSPIQKEDIQNIEFKPNLSNSTVLVKFNIINNKWIEDGVISSKSISITLNNLKVFPYTNILNYIPINIYNITTSELKKSSNGIWTDNTTIKSLIANNIVGQFENKKVLPFDIEIINVEELGISSNDNFQTLKVNFNLSNYLGVDVTNHNVENLNMTTVITGFKIHNPTSMNSKILALNNESLPYNQFPSTISELNIQTILLKNINNPFNLPSVNNIKILKKTANDLNGEITLDFELSGNHYIDGNGNFIDKFNFNNIVLFGFKIFTGNTTIEVTNNLQIDAKQVGITGNGGIILNTTSIQNKKELIKAIIRTYIKGVVPESLSIEILNFKVDSSSIVSFDVLISNYYKSNILNTNPLSFTGIKIINIMNNLPKRTFTTPLTLADQTKNISYYTADDNYLEIKKLIIGNTYNISGTLVQNDITFAPDAIVVNAIDNFIDVSYKIRNSKAKNDQGSVVASSDIIKTRINYFSPISLVDTRLNILKPIAGDANLKLYSSDVQNKFNSLKDDKAAQIKYLSDFIEFNISNLNFENTYFNLFPKNNQLTIELFSSNFYNTKGELITTDSKISSVTLNNFAPLDFTSDTILEFSYSTAENLFASQINLENIKKIVQIKNLPLNTNVTYEFTPNDILYFPETDTYSENGSLDLTITIDRYIQNGVIYNKEKIFTTTPDQIKTKANISTQLPKEFLESNSQTYVILGKDLRITSAKVFAEREANIQKFVFDNLIQKTPGLKAQGITINNLIINDDVGTIEFTFKLNSFYLQGQESTTDFNPVKLIINGFKTVYVPTPTLWYESQAFIIICSSLVGSLLLLSIIFIIYKIRLKRNK